MPDTLAHPMAQQIEQVITTELNSNPPAPKVWVIVYVMHNIGRV